MQYKLTLLSILWVYVLCVSSESTESNAVSTLSVETFSSLVNLCEQEFLQNKMQEYPSQTSPPPPALARLGSTSQPPNRIHRSSVKKQPMLERQSGMQFTFLERAASASRLKGWFASYHYYLDDSTVDYNSTGMVDKSNVINVISQDVQQRSTTCSTYDTEYIDVFYNSSLSHEPASQIHACNTRNSPVVVAYKEMTGGSACEVQRRVVREMPCWTQEMTLDMRPENVVTPLGSGGQDEKVVLLQRLSSQNRGMLQDIVHSLRTVLGTYSSWSTKAKHKIIEKSKRHEILSQRPWFRVEHIRDALRFKARLKTLDSFPNILSIFLSYGLTIVQLDADKFLTPKGFGWRPQCVDLRFPNKQIVEFYAVPIDMDVKAVKSPNHDIYEEWRTKIIDYSIDPQRCDLHSSACRDAVGYSNAKFTSNYRYSLALHRWYTRQGIASYDELKSKFWTSIGDIISCPSYCEFDSSSKMCTNAGKK